MNKPEHNKINYKLMTEKLDEWVEEIENDKTLMECLRRLADK